MGCNTSKTSTLPDDGAESKRATGIAKTTTSVQSLSSQNVKSNKSNLGVDTDPEPSSRLSFSPYSYSERPNADDISRTVSIKDHLVEQGGTGKSELGTEEQLTADYDADKDSNASSIAKNTIVNKRPSSQEKINDSRQEVVEAVLDENTDEQSSHHAPQDAISRFLPSEPEILNSSSRHLVKGSCLLDESCKSNITDESPNIKEHQEAVDTQTQQQMHQEDDQSSGVSQIVQSKEHVSADEAKQITSLTENYDNKEQRLPGQEQAALLSDFNTSQDLNSVGNINQSETQVDQETQNNSDINQSKCSLDAQDAELHPVADQSVSRIEPDARNQHDSDQPNSIKEQATEQQTDSDQVKFPTELETQHQSEANLSNQSESWIEQDAGNQPVADQSKSPIEQEAGHTHDVWHQERFSQGIRSFCRLVDAEELLELANPYLKTLTLERAPAGSGFPFKKLLLKLTGITILNLSGNQLGPQAFRVVAMAMCYNKTIQSLDLSNNYSDTDSSECLGKMLSMNSTLVNLSVSSNKLGKDFFSRCVGPALGHNTSIKILSASSCGISDLNVLLDNLNHNSTLEELDISHNHIRDSEDFANRLKEVLKSPGCRLKRLHLRNCGVGNAGMKQLTEAVCLNTSLDTLHAGGNTVASLSELTSLIVSTIKHPAMTSCNISDTSVTSQEPTGMVPDILGGVCMETISVLTSLNIAKCSLSDDIITSLANHLPGSLPNLSDLDLTGNSAVTMAALGAISTLLTANGNSSNLKHLHLGSLSISGLFPILQGSHTWATLHTLDLRRSKVTASEVGDLGLLCQTPSGLLDLCLEGLKLSGTDALKCLFISSGSKCSLQSLSLASCALQDTDIQPITAAVSDRLAIHSLKLSANRLTDKGAVSLMESFITKGDDCQLEELNLANNRLTDECADTVAKMLSSLSCLCSLLLGHNSLSGEGLNTILSSLSPSEPSNLRILDVSNQDSHLHEDDLAELFSLVAKKLSEKMIIKTSILACLI